MEENVLAEDLKPRDWVFLGKDSGQVNVTTESMRISVINMTRSMLVWAHAPMGAML